LPSAVAVAFFPLAASLFGLLVGSFVNVVIYRVPRGESVVFPPSRCTVCGHRISPLENVPVVSWLALGGRCRSCRSPISIRYPLVELVVGALFGLSAIEYGPTLTCLAASLLSAVLVAVLFFDLDHLLIPDAFVVPCAMLGFSFSLAQHRMLEGVESAVLAGGVFLFIYLATRGRGMGLGDVKLAAALGLALQVNGAIALVAVSFIAGAAIALPVLVAGSRGRRDALPFGPFLVIAGLILVFAPQLAFAPFEAYRHWVQLHGAAL
jgi:leader peptidase (prepilin peptidase) / N-methyltransferase